MSSKVAFKSCISEVSDGRAIRKLTPLECPYPYVASDYCYNKLKQLKQLRLYASTLHFQHNCGCAVDSIPTGWAHKKESS
jgi:hypothetical protein